jgi:hypothetical protein
MGMNHLKKDPEVVGNNACLLSVASYIYTRTLTEIINVVPSISAVLPNV